MRTLVVLSVRRLLKRHCWPHIRRLLAKWKIDAFIHRPGYHYVPDYYGRSAHKYTDIRQEPIFGELATQVISQGTTLLYYDRLYTIYQLLLHITRNSLRISENPIHLAEVGVFKGGTSFFIASLLKDLDFQHSVLHCFDTFEGHVAKDVYTPEFREPFHKPGLFSNTQYDSVKAYLERFSNITLYRGRFQDTCSLVADKEFHFVHLDVDLYEVTRAGLEFFGRSLANSGVILVDDYGFVTCPGVKKAVDQFARDHSNYLSLPLLTGQCVLIKVQS